MAKPVKKTVQISGKGPFRLSEYGQYVYLHRYSWSPWPKPNYTQAYLLPDDTSVTAIKRAHRIYYYYVVPTSFLVCLLAYATYRKWSGDTPPWWSEVFVPGFVGVLPVLIGNALMKRALSPFEGVDVEIVSKFSKPH